MKYPFRKREGEVSPSDMSTSGNFARQFADIRAFIDRGIEVVCGESSPLVPPRLRDSMAYSLLAGGKRLRPALCLKGAELFGIEGERAFPLALSFEMIHTASLIHDDLPAMDDDVLRRGKATNHVLFGEATAILAGDALMALAFEYPLRELPEKGIAPERICSALSLMASALGPSGICGGQVLDMDGELLSEETPWRIARQKTAVLLSAAVTAGAILGGADEGAQASLRAYGNHLGTAFQIVDDILDVTSTAEELGKTPGKDAAQKKKTFVSVYGMEKALSLASEQTALAVAALENLPGDTAFFSGLADYLTERTF